MKKIDARKQTRDALNERRKQVIRLHQKGVPVMQIVERTGLSWSAVNTAITRYQADGASALMPAARGRQQGTGRILTEEQEAVIRQMIRKRRPKYYGLKYSLWDRDTVTQLIGQNYEIKLSVRAVGNYLKRWGLTLKKPNKRPYERCSREIREWLDVHYAEIQQQALREKADIYWLNRPAAIDTDVWRRIDTSKDQTPETRAVDGTGKKLSMVSVVTNQGKVRWAISNGSFDSDRQIKFVKALREDTRKKVLFLIRCDHDVYCSQKFMDWTKEKTERATIRVFPDPKGRTQKSD